MIDKIIYKKETGEFFDSNGVEIVFSKHISSSSGKSYFIKNIDGKSYLAHRLAFYLVKGEWPENQIDHIDGNGLNNKWENLRHATHSENQRNRKLNKNNKSGFCGCYWNKREKKWRAQAMVNGKMTYIGSFHCLNDAVEARKSFNLKNGFHENHGIRKELF